MKTREVAFCAIVAAAYFVFTVAMAPIGYGLFQIRLADGLIMLCLYKKKAIAGIAVGTALANLFSPLGVIDVVLGVAASLVMCWIANKTRKGAVSVVAGAAIVGAVVGGELWAIDHIAFVYGFLGVFFGEIISLWLGWQFCRGLEKRGVLEYE